MKLNKLILPIFLISLGINVKASDIASAEASYIYNFIRYVKWPENNTNKDFVIGVYGESDVYKELSSISSNRKIGSQNLVIRKIKTIDEAIHCQLIFIPSSKKNDIKDIAVKVGNKPILLISEASSSSDCVIEFVYPNDKLQFKVNEEKAKQQKLYLSQSLINLAYKI
jgi:hypothetical protein